MRTQSDYSLQKIPRYLLILLLAVLPGRSVRAQMDRTEMLDQIAKLQVYISQAEKGYQLVKQGLSTIGNLKQGDFNLHSLFFSSLQLVNPAIRSYIKIADIITMETTMLTSYHQYYNQTQSSGLFGKGELGFIYNVYTGLVGKATDDITELTGIITDGDLQMNDAQRLDRIDRLYTTVSAKYQSFQGFNNKVGILLLQKQATLQNLQSISQLFQP